MNGSAVCALAARAAQAYGARSSTQTGAKIELEGMYATASISDSLANAVTAKTAQAATVVRSPITSTVTRDHDDRGNCRRPLRREPALASAIERSIEPVE